jgi:hypothetical protein
VMGGSSDVNSVGTSFFLLCNRGLGTVSCGSVCGTLASVNLSACLISRCCLLQKGRFFWDFRDIFRLLVDPVFVVSHLTENE